MTDAKPNVLVEVTISAPIDTVWKAVRDPEQIAQWFGWQAETLAEEIALIFGSRPLSDALGLPAQWDAKPDSPSLVELPTESQNVSASYRTGFQLGLHVPAWGDGMLVVTDMPADAKKPARGSLLITTFGVEEQAASEFARRWTQWWEGRHPPASV